MPFNMPAVLKTARDPSCKGAVIVTNRKTGVVSLLAAVESWPPEDLGAIARCYPPLGKVTVRMDGKTAATDYGDITLIKRGKGWNSLISGFEAAARKEVEEANKVKAAPKPERHEAVGEVTESEYNGKPVLSLPIGSTGKYDFSFGVAKARAIVAHIDAIRSFVEKHGGEA